MLCCLLVHLCFVVSYAYMVLNAEKRNKLAELVAHCKAALADAGTSTPADTPPTASSGLSPSAPPLVDLRQKGVAEVATASEDEGTCTGLVFKRKRGADIVAPSNSASDGHTPCFRENPLVPPPPRDLMVLEGGGWGGGGGERLWR